MYFEDTVVLVQDSEQVPAMLSGIVVSYRWVSDQALAIYINSKFFPTAVSRFRKFFSSRSSSELRAMLIKMGPTNEALRFLFPIFAEFCINEFAAEISRYRDLVSTADLTKPDAW